MKIHPHSHPLSRYSYFALCVIFLFSVIATPVFTQSISVIPNDNPAPGPEDDPTETDYSTTIIVDLPSLSEVVRADSVEPFYSYLYILGDGDFKMNSLSNTAKHVYLTEGASSTYTGRVYSIGSYSDGEEPPKLLIPPVSTSLSDDLIPDTVQRVVASGEWLNVQRNAEIKPGETAVHVLSFRNNSSTFTNGSVIFLYGSPIATESIKKTGQRGNTPLPNFANFTHNETLVYHDEVDQSALWYTTLPAGVSSQYQYALAYNFSELAPNEEVRVFVDLSSDPNLMSGLDAKQKHSVKFMTLLYTQDGGDPSISEEEQEAINDIDLQTLVGTLVGKPADIMTVFDQQENQSDTSDQTNIVYNLDDATLKDVYLSKGDLVLAHDPNYIAAQACACTDGHEEYHKLLLTVHCENDGYGAATHIFMDVLLPEGMSADLVMDSAILYHPYVTGSEDRVFMEKLDDRTIRWHMDGFQLEGVPNYGVGHPLTYAEINFVAFTKQDPSTLDSLQALVRFGSVDSEPVYTPRVKVALVDAASIGSESLVCGTCEELDQLGCFNFWCTVPWWVWLVLVLLIIVAILVYRSWTT